MCPTLYRSGRRLHRDGFGNLVTDFVGRQAQLDMIISHFSKTSHDRPQILSICGLPGEGKTRLALEYCNRLQKTYRGIYWIHAMSDMTALHSFESIAAQLVSEREGEDLNPARSVRLVLAKLRSWNERWLMVFDSYDRPEDFPDIKRLIPQGGKGDVLLTSRSTDLRLLGKVLEVPPLTNDQALELLLRSYPKLEVEQHKFSWLSVTTKLGNLALSIDHAAEYLRLRNVPIEKPKSFLMTYEEMANCITLSLSADFWKVHKTQCRSSAEQTRARSAFITWEMLLAQLGAIDTQSEDSIHHFLSLLAFLGPLHTDNIICPYSSIDELPVWMDVFTTWTKPGPGSGEVSLKGGERTVDKAIPNETLLTCDGKMRSPAADANPKWDSDRFWKSVCQLHELSLLSRVSGTGVGKGSFCLHPLIRNWVQAKQTPEAQQAYTQEAVKLVLQALSTCASLSKSAQQRLALKIYVDACKWNDDHFTTPAQRLGCDMSNCMIAECFVSHYRISGRYEQAKALEARIVQTRKQNLGTEHPVTLESMENLADIYCELGEWGQAEELKREVVAIQLGNPPTGGAEISKAFHRLRLLAQKFRCGERWKELKELYSRTSEKIRQADAEGVADLIHVKRFWAFENEHKAEITEEHLSSLQKQNLGAYGARYVSTPDAEITLARVFMIRERMKQKAVQEVRSVRAVDEEPPRLGNQETQFEEDESQETAGAISTLRQKWEAPDTSDTERIRAILLASAFGYVGDVRRKPGTALSMSEMMAVSDLKSSIEYTALDQVKQEIRLLTIYPGNFNDELRGKLCQVSLKSDPEYTALSYCWGDPKAGADVWIDGKKTQVTRSLETALKYVRKSTEDTVLWADAICINQNNADEKSSQVRMMGEIYSKATDVWIWLGESADDSDAAMDFLNTTTEEDFAKSDFELAESVWVALRHLGMREWWSRMWVIQEALFAKRLKFHCGYKSADRIHFTRFRDIVAKYRRVEKPEERLRAMSMTTATPFGVILLDWDQYKRDLAQGGVRIMRLLGVTTDSRCTDPRDRIFALLSMCSKLDQQVLEVDYRSSLRELLIKFCKYRLIEREIHRPLAVLQTCRTTKNPLLPSWVPDHTSGEDHDALVVPIAEGRTAYTAAADNVTWTTLGLASLKPYMMNHFNSLRVVIEDEGSFETLVLTGLVVDSIQAAFRAPWVDIYSGFDPTEDRQCKALRREKIVQACKEWENYTQSLPAGKDPYRETCGRYEAFWRTLIADRDMFWDGPPSQAQDFAGRFEAWMGRHAEKSADEDFVRPFNQAAIVRCMRRSFFVTEKGYFGLGSCYPRASDVVCVLRGGDVPFVLRRRLDEYYEWVGEAYVHGIMDGSFVRSATWRQLRQFKPVKPDLQFSVSGLMITN